MVAIAGYPLTAKPATPAPNIVASTASLTNPDTATGACPDRPGSSGTANTPHAMAAAAGAAITRIQCQGGVIKVHAARPIPVRQAASNRKRSPRLIGLTRPGPKPASRFMPASLQQRLFPNQGTSAIGQIRRPQLAFGRSTDLLPRKALALWLACFLNELTPLFGRPEVEFSGLVRVAGWMRTTISARLFWPGFRRTPPGPLCVRRKPSWGQTAGPDFRGRSPSGTRPELRRPSATFYGSWPACAGTLR